MPISVASTLYSGTVAAKMAQPRVKRLPQWPPPRSGEDPSPSPPPVPESRGPVAAPRVNARTSMSPPCPAPTTPKSREKPPAPLPNDQPPPRPLPPRNLHPAPTSLAPDPAGESFGSCLQAQTCYDAINKRHEDELRALESLRVHIFHRAKADKEYAESLAKANTRAAKGMANLNQSSTIVQVQPSHCMLACL